MASSAMKLDDWKVALLTILLIVVVVSAAVSNLAVSTGKNSVEDIVSSTAISEGMTISANAIEEEVDINGFPLRFCPSCNSSSISFWHHSRNSGVGDTTLAALTAMSYAARKGWNYVGECAYELIEVKNRNPEEYINIALTAHQRENADALRFVFGAANRGIGGSVVFKESCNQDLLTRTVREGLPPQEWHKNIWIPMGGEIPTEPLFRVTNDSGEGKGEEEREVVARVMGDELYQNLLRSAVFYKAEYLDDVLDKSVMGRIIPQVNEQARAVLSNSSFLAASIAKISSTFFDSTSITDSRSSNSLNEAANGRHLIDDSRISTSSSGSNGGVSSEVSAVTVAVHIRRGDVNPKHAEDRFITDKQYVQLIRAIKRVVPKAQIHGFSNLEYTTTRDSFKAFEKEGVVMHFDAEETVIQSLSHLVLADVYVMSLSTFGYLGGILNQKCVIFQDRVVKHENIPPYRRWINSTQLLRSTDPLKRCLVNRGKI